MRIPHEPTGAPAPELMAELEALIQQVEVLVRQTAEEGDGPSAEDNALRFAMLSSSIAPLAGFAELPEVPVDPVLASDLASALFQANAYPRPGPVMPRRPARPREDNGVTIESSPGALAEWASLASSAPKIFHAMERADDYPVGSLDIETMKEAAEADSIFSDPMAPILARIFTILMQLLKRLDRDIQGQAKRVQTLQRGANHNGGDSKSIDVEVMKLKRLSDKRSQSFDQFRELIGKYVEQWKRIIDSIGR